MSIAEQQSVLTDLAFPESVRWHDGRLWVSDWGAGMVLATAPGGQPDVVARVESFPLCIDFLPDGRLLLADSSARRVLRREPDGSLVTHAELAHLSEHPWNEIVVDRRGHAYVNNIGFDFPDGEFAPGTLALVTPDGAARRVAGGLAFPNGMAVTPDGTTLIVAESYAQQLTAFAIAEDGSLGEPRVWARVADHPDGICLAPDGTVWYADVGTSRCVRVREGGEVLETVDLAQGCFSCVLGGDNLRTLYVATNAWGEDPADARARGELVAVHLEPATSVRSGLTMG